LQAIKDTCRPTGELKKRKVSVRVQRSRGKRLSQRGKKRKSIGIGRMCRSSRYQTKGERSSNPGRGHDVPLEKKKEPKEASFKTFFYSEKGGIITKPFSKERRLSHERGKGENVIPQNERTSRTPHYDDRKRESHFTKRPTVLARAA